MGINEKEHALLHMEGITKMFPGVKALDNVSLTVRAGTVHALMGENGAGKSTLMKCLFGVYQKDEGHIYLDGQEVSFKNSKDALEHGVAMVHQELNQALKRNVMDNMWLGRYPKKGLFIDEDAMFAKTVEVFKDLGIEEIDPKIIMKDLPVSKRQMVEIAKAVSYKSKVIVFDEPTSSLNEAEVERFFSIVNMLKNRGCAIIYISHKMAEIKRISDDITIMRDGTWVATHPTKDLEMNDIIKLMVGRELTNVYPPKTNVPGDVYLKVEGITGEYNHLKDVTFEARSGEILGIAGLSASGRSSALESIFGLRTRKAGKIYLGGQEVGNNSPIEAIKNGFALLTEERRATGILGVRNIRENTVISSTHRHRISKWLPFLRSQSQYEDTDYYIKAMHIKTHSQEAQIRSLSGGNQQKVIIGRWLLTEPEVLLLDEPTRGIDVGAKYEIYQLINDLASKGKTVLMVSSEMPELLGVCDRILVMSGGRVAGEVDAKNTNQEEIMTLAAKYV